MRLDQQDWELEVLLSMDEMVLEAGGGLWYRIRAHRVHITPGRPHGIRYALTLHDINNERIFGIDNAHSPKFRKGRGQKRRKVFDHKHEGKTVKVYEYTSAADLLQDFFDAIDRELRKRGVKP